MNDIQLFTSKQHLDAKANLNDFIEMCRDRLTVFGTNLDWNSDTWPGVCNFTVIGAPSRGFTTNQLLNPKIIPFAKSYVRYQHQYYSNSSSRCKEIKGIRCVEKALLQVKGKADITLTDLNVLDMAAQVAREYKASAYQAGCSIVKLVEFLNRAKIVPHELVWKNPISKPNELNRTDAATKAKRRAKVPQDHCLEYMAEMFSNDLQDPRDRFTTSIFAMLMCAPSRISEVQELPVNCLHTESDSQGTERLGLRFYAAKGYGSDIKWISTPFKSIASEAIRRLVALSNEGRKLASWYEENPHRFYRHPGCPRVNENAALSNEQACRALGISEESATGSLWAYFKSYSPFQTLRAKGESLTLAFLNEFCRSKLPDGWPWFNKERNIKYSEALCCFRSHELRVGMNTSPVLLWKPGGTTFTTDLNYINGQERNVWIRHGYKNPDGTEISMTSHQVRHYLNTAAQRGSLAQLDIAKWSGRANIHQNATYNHMADDEYVDMARQAGVGGLLQKVKLNAPVTFADLDAVGEGIAHVTEYGFCVHDFSMLPCQKHRDCLNCIEQVCVKGDEEKLERLKKQRDGIRLQLIKALDASENSVYGADRWSQHQITTLERVGQLIEILESPSTANGSVIHLSIVQEFSPLRREIAAHTAVAKSAAPSISTRPDVDELRILLGV
ncbi:integrase [Pseudomonas sp. K2I15]|uniref:integrase n=1 Tax=Pseudomonas sp. K2I15 TaxID=2013577 RepID=UPI000B4CA712|nr:integrase [Pseudomonas sp. K2I15]OWP71056.1 integrase [Pseudomonas sp. K2I15]